MAKTFGINQGVIYYGVERVSTGCEKYFMQDRGQRGSVKTLEFLIANDNVVYDYALAA